MLTEIFGCPAILDRGHYSAAALAELCLPLFHLRHDSNLRHAMACSSCR